LNATLEFRSMPGLFFAGQVTGTEGYVESTTGGLIAGVNAARAIAGFELRGFPVDTAMGSLAAYISAEERREFQPMNISFGLMPSYFEIPKRDKSGRKIAKRERREMTADRALASLRAFRTQLENMGEVPQVSNF
ncbi:MAG: FAD-dependent oxidoreductase, partial [Bdellovibrionales bacterium]|nr:FAD-dependent oxidoreductase [Bdellovibrionales bacterium]